MSVEHPTPQLPAEEEKTALAVPNSTTNHPLHGQDSPLLPQSQVDLPTIELPAEEETANVRRLSNSTSVTQVSKKEEDNQLVLASTQPTPMPPPSIPAIPKQKPSTTYWERRRKVQTPPMILRILHVIGTILKIIFVYVIPGSILAAVALALCIALPFACLAGQCAAVMVIGNTILNAAHLPGYTTNAHAAAIGATGAVFAGIIVGMVAKCVVPNSLLRYQEDALGGEPAVRYPWYITFFTSLLVSVLGAVIGFSILRHNHVDLGGITTLNAARVAAVGGAVFAVGMALLGPLLMIAIGIILSPLWIAMMFGLKWVYARSNASWEQRGDWTHTSSSHCYCYGYCERDDEIDAELAKIGR